MKVLFILPTLFRGGAEKSTLYLATRLRDAGVETALLTMYTGGELLKDFRDAGIPVFVRRSARDFVKDALPKALLDALYRRRFNRNRKLYLDRYFQPPAPEKGNGTEEFVKAKIRSLAPDIVHVHQSNCLDALRWARECGVRTIVYTHHNMTSEALSPEEIRRVGNLAGFSDWITFVSAPQREDFLRHVRYARERTSVIHPQTTFVGKPKDRDRKSSTLVLGTLSNLSPNKNPSVLLDALKEIRGEGRDVRLSIAGGDPRWKVTVEEAVKDRHLEEWVRFVGELRTDMQLREFYTSLDVYVSPSLSESFSLTVVEAMSCGVPVLSSDVEPIRELLDDGTTGLFFRRGDVADLVSKIRQFAEDPLRREDMGKKALAKFRAQFDRQAAAEEYLKLYEQLLHRT